MNTLNRLNNVISKPTRYIAQVDKVNNNGTSTVIHSDGSKEVVIGDNINTGHVYINDGVIVGQAASLAYVEIDV